MRNGSPAAASARGVLFTPAVRVRAFVQNTLFVDPIGGHVPPGVVSFFFINRIRYRSTMRVFLTRFHRLRAQDWSVPLICHAHTSLSALSDIDDECDCHILCKFSPPGSAPESWYVLEADTTDWRKERTENLIKPLHLCVNSVVKLPRSRRNSVAHILS